jgi:hypothetical protein
VVVGVVIGERVVGVAAGERVVTDERVVWVWLQVRGWCGCGYR